MDVYIKHCRSLLRWPLCQSNHFLYLWWETYLWGMVLPNPFGCLGISSPKGSLGWLPQINRHLSAGNVSVWSAGSTPGVRSFSTVNELLLKVYFRPEMPEGSATKCFRRRREPGWGSCSVSAFWVQAVYGTCHSVLSRCQLPHPRGKAIVSELMEMLWLC